MICTDDRSSRLTGAFPVRRVLGVSLALFIFSISTAASAQSIGQSPNFSLSPQTVYAPQPVAAFQGRAADGYQNYVTSKSPTRMSAGTSLSRRSRGEVNISGNPQPANRSARTVASSRRRNPLFKTTTSPASGMNIPPAPPLPIRRVK